MGMGRTILAAGLLAVGPLATHAAVFRCTAPDGAVTYQELPCPEKSGARALDVPTEYPPIDARQRQDLMQREVALYQRLEARRERESREAIASIGADAQVQAAQAQAQAVSPGYVLGWPRALWPRPIHRSQRPLRSS